MTTALELKRRFAERMAKASWTDKPRPGGMTVRMLGRVRPRIWQVKQDKDSWWRVYVNSEPSRSRLFGDNLFRTYSAAERRLVAVMEARCK